MSNHVPWLFEARASALACSLCLSQSLSSLTHSTICSSSVALHAAATAGLGLARNRDSASRMSSNL